MKKLIIGLLALGSVSVYAEDKLQIYWNCYLPGDVVSCDDLKTSYISANPGMEITSRDTAYFSVTLRSLDLNNATEYQYTFTGEGNLPSISFKYPLNATLSPNEKFEKVLSMMNKLTDPYKLILNHSSGSANDSESKPFYFAPALSGNGSKNQGSQSLTTSLNFTANYSTPKWRIVAGGDTGYIYNSQDTNAYNTGITTKVYYHGEGVAVIRSLSNHWDIAVMADNVDVKTDIALPEANSALPQNALSNTAHKTSARVGAEWILIPFITEKSNGNVAVRYTLGGEFHKYVDPNSFQYVQEEFLRHSLQVLVAQHFRKVDVGVTVSAFKSSLRDINLMGVSSSASVSYKISSRLTLSGNISLQYAKGRVLSAAESNNSFTGLTSGKKEDLTYTGLLSLKYTLGNTRLFNNEQRWKTQ